jgi:hypothetical protein
LYSKYWNDQIKEGEMVGEYSMHFSEINRFLEDLGVDERIKKW